MTDGRPVPREIAAVSHLKIPWLLGAALALAAVAGLAGDPACAQVESSSCRSTCLAQYNQCRISTKGSPSCDAQYQSCLQACIAQRH